MVEKDVLPHNNMGPHSMVATVEAIKQLECELLLRPPYSPDLNASDYCMFNPLTPNNLKDIAQ
jgi:transposase